MRKSVSRDQLSKRALKQAAQKADEEVRRKHQWVLYEYGSRWAEIVDTAKTAGPGARDVILKNLMEELVSPLAFIFDQRAQKNFSGRSRESSWPAGRWATMYMCPSSF
jgi:hypothetical protein